MFIPQNKIPAKMKHSISIGYITTRNISHNIPVSYKINEEAAQMTLSCLLEQPGAYPDWLQMRKFEVVAQLQKDGYSALYNEDNEARNIDCALFIDAAFKGILLQEKMRMVATVEN